LTLEDTTSPPGETLETRLARRSLPLAEALDLAAQIAARLAVLGDRGIVHGDVRPANVRISAEEQVELLDPGKPAEAPPGGAADSNPYRSPEQLRGSPLDARTDV